MAVTGVSESTIIDSLRETYTREAEKPKAGNDMGKDEFMKLLIAQLKNQDPLSPMDDKEFISQQAQFSSLEQMTNMNKNFESFIKTMQSDRTTLAVSYLGTQVTLSAPETEAGVVSGQVKEIRYKEGVPMLVVNDAEWPLTSLTSVAI